MPPTSAKIRLAGIVVGNRRLGDGLITSRIYDPPQVNDVPDYEESLVKALREYVALGDRVVVVGCGTGVTCAVAAILSQKRVDCFEGDFEAVEATKRTARLNGVLDKVNVVHAIVGENIGVYGNSFAEKIMHPSEIPDCDVLELDCEGAELQILREMKIAPRVIAVETHGVFGSPTEKVRAVLESRGYKVTEFGLAEPRWAAACITNGIEVLVGET